MVLIKILISFDDGALLIGNISSQRKMLFKKTHYFMKECL